MIDVNLAPPNLRRRQKHRILPKGFYMPPEVVIGCGGGFLVLLVVVHIYIILKHISINQKYSQIEKKWEQILPAKKQADKVISQIRQLHAKEKDVEELIGVDRILWARKLNIISDSLPRGVWLRRVAFEDGRTFVIEGSAISRQQNEMAAIHEFTHNLRQGKLFLKHFQEMDIGSMTRRQVKDRELVDFSIVAGLKIEQKAEDEDSGAMNQKIKGKQQSKSKGGNRRHGGKN